MATLRKWHRTVALILALFIFIIGLTGAILQGILAVYGDPGPGGVNLPANIAPIRQLLFQIHTGFIAGMPGVYYGLILGLGLLFFSLSGLWIYTNLWRSRAQLGRKTLFWRTRTRTDATQRSLHRWFTVGVVLFTTLISFTGTSLDFDFARNNILPGAGPRRMAPGQAMPGPGDPNGQALSNFDREWHEGNFAVHKLNFLGRAGHFIGVLVGLGLATMAVSGVLIYFAMYGRRKAAGEKGLFW